jgi:LmbE family N-acetylglucosaminyl deacetylase
MIAVVGAHPDDAELGAGGLLALRGGVIIHATTGENHCRNARQAEGEAREAAQILGVQYCILWVHEHLTASQAVVAMFDNAFKEFGVDAVITHHPRDTHQEHALVSQIAVAAARRIHNVAFFEGQPPSGQHPYFQPHLYHDITGVESLKYAAIEAYRTQASKNLLPPRKAIDAHRGQERGVNAAEAFEILRWDLT